MRIFILIIILILPVMELNAVYEVVRIPDNSITIDGKPDEMEWSYAAFLEISTNFSSCMNGWFTETKNGTDYRINADIYHIKFLYDNTNLYFSLTSDDKYIEKSDFTLNADGLNLLAIQIKNTTDKKVYRYTWHTLPPEKLDNLNDSGIQAEFYTNSPFTYNQNNDGDDQGYNFEIKIPLAHIGNYTNGDYIPVQLHLVDHDGKPDAAYDDPDVDWRKFWWGHWNFENLPYVQNLYLSFSSAIIPSIMIQPRIISTHNTTDRISWGEIPYEQCTNWRLAEDYLEVNYHSGDPYWGLMIYTDNTNSSFSPYIHEPVPGAKYNGLIGVNEPQILPLIWAASTNNQVPVSFPVNPDNPGPWMWMKDIFDDDWGDLNNENNPVLDYASVISGKGLLTVTGRQIEKINRFYLFFGARFKDTYLQPYKTQSITLELFHQ